MKYFGTHSKTTNNRSVTYKRDVEFSADTLPEKKSRMDKMSIRWSDSYCMYSVDFADDLEL